MELNFDRRNVYTFDTPGMCSKDYLYRLDKTQYPDGKHTIGVRVTDGENQTAYTEIEVILLNVAINCITGDVNGDRNINIIDALMIAQYYVGLISADFRTECADVNCDGQINMIRDMLESMVLRTCPAMRPEVYSAVFTTFTVLPGIHTCRRGI